MATAIDGNKLNEFPVMDYSEFRDNVNSGDLFFASGNYLVSKAIQKATSSVWSHVGILFNLKSINRILLLESVEDMGVRFAPLSKYLSDYSDGQPYDGRCAIARCSEMTDTLSRGVASFGIEELTRPYDKEEIGRILARISLGLGKRKDDREYICSELVYECFRSSGITFPYNTKDFISPDDIWLDQRVKFITRIL